MPSRKRSKGKARKAKQAGDIVIDGESKKAPLKGQADDEAQVLIRLLLNNLSFQDKCHHGCPAPSTSEGICHKIMHEVESALNSFYTDVYDHSAPSHGSPYIEYCYVINHLQDNGLGDAFYDDGMRNGSLACLISLGTKYCLMINRETVLSWRKAAMVGVFVVFLEKGFSLRNASEVASLLDLVGDWQEAIRFFSKRNPCSCLDQKLAQCSDIKLGLCGNICCSKTKRRRDMMLCARCRCKQYCSESCQKEDWYRHKANCNMWHKKFSTTKKGARGGGGSKMTF